MKVRKLVKKIVSKNYFCIGISSDFSDFLKIYLTR